WIPQLVNGQGDELALQHVPVLQLLAVERVLEQRGGDDAHRSEAVPVRLGTWARRARPRQEAETAIPAQQWQREHGGDVPVGASDEVAVFACFREQGEVGDRAWARPMGRSLPCS